MVSTGGADQSVFVWHFHPEGGLDSSGYDSEEALVRLIEAEMEQRGV